MAKKLKQRLSEPRKVADQDLPAARLPDSRFPANSQQQVVSVAEGQRAANSYQQLLQRNRDTSEVQELKKAGYGQSQSPPKKEKPKDESPE